MHDHKALLRAAEKAAGNAYNRYSGVSVGAAIATGDGRVFTGCNVENASFGLTICAERAAAVSAVSAGAREFTAVALYLHGSSAGDVAPQPCGACLQFLAEFAANDTPIICSPDDVRVLGDHLPRPFRL